MYHRVFRYALGGATAYVVCDALDELFIYLHCRRIGMRAARGSDELRAEIGIDMRAGPWYNSSLRTSHYGHMASCSFPVEGDRLGTEVAVRLVRARGVPSSFVHNVIGTGKWRIMSATATLPGAGGLPRTLNLAGFERLVQPALGRLLASAAPGQPSESMPPPSSAEAVGIDLRALFVDTCNMRADVGSGWDVPAAGQMTLWAFTEAMLRLAQHAQSARGGERSGLAADVEDIARCLADVAGISIA